MVEMLCKIGIKLTILLALIGVCELIVEWIPLLDKFEFAFTGLYAAVYNLAQTLAPYFNAAMGFVNKLLSYGAMETQVAHNMFVVLMVWTIFKRPVLKITTATSKAVLTLIGQ